MSNNINRIRKNKLKGTGIFAAAALTAALIAGNNIPGVTRQVSAAESQENTVSSLIPDNITLDKPVELANVELPATEYGTFEWADGSFVPAQRVQSCEVLLIPAEGQDLSHVDGWDPESGAVVGYINVIVNSITDSDNSDKTEAQVKQIQQKMQIQQKRLKLRQKNLPQMKTLIQTIKKIRKVNQIRIIKLIQTMKRIRLKKIKQIIKTTKIITAMQIRRIKIQKLPVSWNLQMI